MMFSRSLGLGSRRTRAAFTLVELLVVIAIIGILVALLLPAIQAAREAARRAQFQSNMHNAGLAVLNYESARKRLPYGFTFDPAKFSTLDTINTVGPNWIIDVLPYMEEQGLRDSFDPGVFIKPGTTGFTPINDNPANARNQKARAAVISVLLCPSDPFNKTQYQGGASGASNHGRDWGRSNYAASQGRAFIWHSNGADFNFGADPVTGKQAAGWTDPCQRGVMGPNQSVTLKRITDGTSKTIMLGEIRTGVGENDARGVWALAGASASLLAKYGSTGDANGPNSCSAKGDDTYSSAASSATYCSPSPSPDCMDTGGAYMAQATVRSVHPGGAFVAMADGSVEFVSNDIETSGCYGECCTAWDRMIASADEGRNGLLNVSSLNVPCQK